MQPLQIYNASLTTQHVPGVARCLPGKRVQAFVTQSEFDDVFEALLRRAPLTGLAVMDPSSSFTLPAAVGAFPVRQARATAVGPIASTTRMQVGVVAGAAYILTLPAATAVPKGETIYVFNDTPPAGNALNIAPNGANTIDGVAANASLTALANVKRFVSDGVSDWKTY